MSLTVLINEELSNHYLTDTMVTESEDMTTSTDYQSQSVDTILAYFHPPHTHTTYIRRSATSSRPFKCTRHFPTEILHAFLVLYIVATCSAHHRLLYVSIPALHHLDDPACGAGISTHYHYVFRDLFGVSAR